MPEPYPISTARILAPEDIAPGQYVSPVERIYEMPARSHCDESTASREIGTLRCRMMASDGPYRVLEVCLPFVLVEDAEGMKDQLDVRDTTLARLSDAYGAAAFARRPEPALDDPDFSALRARVLSHIGAE